MKVQKAISFKIARRKKRTANKWIKKEITVKRWTDKSESLAELY